jgi:hypothetical protein
MIPPGNRVSRRRRPSRILFLLRSKLAKLWAFRLLIPATAKGIMHWRMAPFIDDRQIAQLTTSGPANPGHADTKTTYFPSQMGSPMAELEAVDRAEDISVALEWKLLLPLLAPGAKDPRPDDDRPVPEASCDDEVACLEQAHECVARAIKEAGEEAVTMHSLLMEGVEEKEFWSSSWVVKKANSAVPMEEEKSLKGYTWVPVEICSPKMRLQDAQTRLRMQKVLDALHSKHRLAANCSCEVHIHLGRMDGRAWSLSTLKRLGSLLWVAEPTLRSIRDPNSPNSNNLYTWGFAMRQRSRLARQMLEEEADHAVTVLNEPRVITDEQITTAIRGPSTVPAKEVNAFVRIWRAASHLELGQLLSGPEKMYRRLGFNFSAFGEEDDRAKRNPRTIEFRMMDGSVETRLILGWLAICGTIAETAVTASDHRFGAALGLLLQKSESDERQLREGLTVGEDETLGEQRGREFRELMQALGIEARHYRGFEDKIRREHDRAA